ncbi:MAG: L,D-transpeptidase family protein [Gammaproteobacteria bacterium]|nr:L,D-transpeptidase family protein [Gammaproteobacteria bacterium]
MWWAYPLLASGADVYHDQGHEQPLLHALSDVQAQNLEGALTTVEALVNKDPAFRLAQLVYADLLLAKAHTAAQLGAEGGAPHDGIADLMAEAKARWQHPRSHDTAPMLPAFLVALPPDQPTALVVDASASRLYVFENQQGTPVLVSDFYVSIGKNGAEKQVEGDKKTPLGVYYVTEHLAAGTLPPYYGVGAFPLNYPNEWDRHLGKTGSGIWLHGNPLKSYSRPPQASDGCVTLSNLDFKELQSYIHIGKTPVVIAPEVNWVAAEEIHRWRAELNGQLQKWTQDWASRDTDRYLAHYAPDFFSPDKDYRQWQDYKRAVNAQKRFIEVSVDRVGMMLYPEQQTLMQVEFEQSYRSDQLSSRSSKRQWWRKERDGQWRIVYEGPA